MSIDIKSVGKKVLRYGPPLFTQIVTYVCTRALANEHEDYGGGNSGTPLLAKSALLVLTLLSALSGLLAVFMGWGVTPKSRFVRYGDIVLQLIALVIVIIGGITTLSGHSDWAARGLACEGPNVRICLPEKSECSSSSKTAPPCDAYGDTSKIATSGKVISNNFMNTIGWGKGIGATGNDYLKYSTVQYQSQGSQGDLKVVSDQGTCSVIDKKGVTSDAGFSVSPASPLDIPVLKNPPITCAMLNKDSFPSFSTNFGVDASACTMVEVEAFNGSKVKTSSCGTNNPVSWSQAAIDAGKVCRYGCAGSYDECLQRGALEKSADDVVSAEMQPLVDHFTKLTTTKVAAGEMTTKEVESNSNKLQKIINPFYVESETTLMADATWYVNKDAHFKSGTPAAGAFVTKGTTPFKQTCDFTVIPTGCAPPPPPPPPDLPVAASNAAKATQAGAVAGNTASILASFGGALPKFDCCVSHATFGVLGQCADLTGNGAWVDCSYANRQMDCGVLANSASCSSCTNAATIPCGADGVSTQAQTEAGGVAVSLATGNTTVGFGTDDEEYRFGTKDWKAAERTWCGSKLLLEGGGGFFGLTVTSVLIMIISTITSAWDSITEIQDKSKGDAALKALGIVLTEIFNVLLFVLPSFKTAMLLYVGHDTAAAAASVTKAAAIEMFMGSTMQQWSTLYKLIVYIIITVEISIALHSLLMSAKVKDTKVRMFGLVKALLMLINVIVLFTPTFGILGAVTATDSETPKFVAMKAAKDDIIATNVLDLDVLFKKLEGTKHLKPVGSVPSEGAVGFAFALAFFLGLLVGLLDQLEILILSKAKMKVEVTQGKDIVTA